MLTQATAKTPPYQFQFTSRDGLRIACARWDTGGPPRGTVQIAHGLGEHIGRYRSLIEALVEAGLVVYGNDHRGQGHTASSPSSSEILVSAVSACLRRTCSA